MAADFVGRSSIWTHVLHLSLTAQCTLPESFKGKIHFDERSPTLNGIFVNFTCDKGYRLHGDPRTVCLNNRQWSGILPKCEQQSSSSSLSSGALAGGVVGGFAAAVLALLLIFIMKKKLTKVNARHMQKSEFLQAGKTYKSKISTLKQKSVCCEFVSYNVSRCNWCFFFLITECNNKLLMILKRVWSPTPAIVLFPTKVTQLVSGI